MIGLLRPELLLLVLPLGLSWRAWGGPLRGHGGLRLALALVLLLAAAGPYVPLAEPGHDVVVVLDRSASMPAEADARELELLRLLEDARAEGDRVGVVVVGRQARVLRAPSADARSAGLPDSSAEEADGSDLAAGLEAALALLSPGKAGRVLLISDGLYDGADPVEVARRAAARGVQIDVRPLSRDWSAGARTQALQVPAEIEPGAPLALVGWMGAEKPTHATWTLYRGDAAISSGEVDLAPGSNRLLLRDRAPSAGLVRYTLAVSAPGDSTPEDDRSSAVTRVTGARQVLVVDDAGGESPVSSALRAAGMQVRVASPETAPLNPADLRGYRAVVLENVASDRLGLGLDHLADWVKDGGGLLMTGGRASFGVGGYYRSPLDPLLPVSMEQRLEQRKLGVAMAIAMDRSGSMSMPVDGGKTKMDLADLGAAAALRALGPMDHVAVLAVDTAAHVVVPLSPVEQPEALAGQILRIQSEGGGIYVRTALASAAKQLEAAPQKNRHITLFADASDSDEQEGCLLLAERLREAGVTISVIALGSKFDGDARFLEQLADKGGGTVAYTLRPSELPRLFASDAMLASRASVVEEPTGTALRPELRTLKLNLDAGPRLGGYNRTWPRSEALTAIVTTDDNHSPVFALRQAGAGRTAAWTGQIGGAWGADALRWSGMGPLLVATTRWLGAVDDPEGWYANARLEGADLVVEVEADTHAAPPDVEPVARLREASGATRELALTRDAEGRWKGRVRAPAEGLTLGVVSLGADRVLELPPVISSGSGELRPPEDPASGARTLRRLAALSGGGVNAPVADLLTGESPTGVGRSLAGPLLGLGLLLTLSEIAWRRLGRPARPRAAAAAPTPPQQAQPPPPPGSSRDNPENSGVSAALSRARDRAGRALDRPR